MLVLTCKQGERVVVPSCRLTITVLESAGRRTRLGFEAPGEIEVHRESVWRRCVAAGSGPEREPKMARILIADADRFLLTCYPDYLEARGYAAATAADAIECLERLRTFEPDVLVLDPSLPWGGGEGVLAVMQDEPTLSAIPVVALTYGRDHGQLYRLAQYHVADLQFKPLAPRQLVARIDAVLGAQAESGPAETSPAALRRPR